MKTKELYNFITSELQSIYPLHEAETMAFHLLEDIAKITTSDIIVNSTLHNLSKDLLDDAMFKLLNNEPIQYVLGKADFYGRSFKVDGNVLIPRSETEELVQLLAKDYSDKSGVRLLDIGTGSGCIAITLYHELHQPLVEAMDISEPAIGIAQENAKLLKAPIVFHQQDILDNRVLPNDYDVIVSNPPYVTPSEKSLMRKNVLDFEPDMALFVEDHDPLVFYKVIAKKAASHLHPNGRLYFEINEQFANEVALLMETQGFSNVAITEDMNGKSRMVSGMLQA